MRKTTINLYGIRPKYQWEFVYDEKQRNAVMDTVWQNFPLNVMYWVKTEASTDLSDLTEQKSGSSVQSVDNIQYELLDGQQRTISICSFIAGEYMMNFDGNLLGFNNMTIEQQNRILDYKLQVYICEGTDEEKLRWFQRINIAGEKLKEQEIRNAIYSGSWVTQAKRRFSKTGCVAYKIGSDFMAGSPIRQDYFETALRWMERGRLRLHQKIICGRGRPRSQLPLSNIWRNSSMTRMLTNYGSTIKTSSIG